jgi:hypothetical protein
MRVGGSGAEVETLRDFMGGAPAPQEVEHLKFTVRQPGQVRRRTGRARVQLTSHLGCDRPADMDLAGQDRTDRGLDSIQGLVFMRSPRAPARSVSSSVPFALPSPRSSASLKVHEPIGLPG